MTQVYITPSPEQLIEFTKENPLFLQEVKEQTNKILLEKSSRYLASRLEQEAQSCFNKFFDNHKAKFYRKDSYGYGSSFTPEIEKDLQEKVNLFFKETLEKELVSYLNSESFKSSINYKIKEKLTQTVLQMLDEEIKQEAKKIIS